MESEERDSEACLKDMIKIKDYGYKPLWNVIATLGEVYKPKAYLEIGVREGDSLKSLIKHHRPELLCLCDTWGTAWGGSGRGNFDHIIELLKDLEFEGEAVFLSGYSQTLVPQLEKKYTFDLILVDGNHSYRGAWLDLHNSWKILKKGGYMAMDDIVHASTPWLLECAMRFSREMPNAEIVHLDKKSTNGCIVFKKC